MALLANGGGLLVSAFRALRSSIPHIPLPSRILFRAAGTSASQPLAADKTAENRSDTKDDGFSEDKILEILKQQQGNMPVEGLSNPYLKSQKQCVICQYNVPLDYKNVRLLSQFVSPHTGRIYGNRITGLCIPIQKRISQLIRRARLMGLMPYMYRDPQFIKDPLVSAPRVKK